MNFGLACGFRQKKFQIRVTTVHCVRLLNAISVEWLKSAKTIQVICFTLSYLNKNVSALLPRVLFSSRRQHRYWKPLSFVGFLLPAHSLPWWSSKCERTKKKLFFLRIVFFLVLTRPTYTVLCLGKCVEYS